MGGDQTEQPLGGEESVRPPLAIDLLPLLESESSTCAWSRRTVWPTATRDGPAGGGPLRLVEPSALPPVCVPQVWSLGIPLPGALRSTGITRLPRYYGSSDSCRSLSGDRQVSLRHVLRLPNHSASNHLVFPRHRFDTLPFSVTGFPVRPEVPSAFRCSNLGSGLRHLPAGSPKTPGRIEFTCVADWPFASRYSPPRLAATQFRSATSR